MLHIPINGAQTLSKDIFISYRNDGCGNQFAHRLANDLSTLGFMYKSGHVTRDLQKAVEYLEKAKAQGDMNVYFIDGETLFKKEDRDACTVEALHPNDLGFYRIAQVLYQILKELV